MSTKEFNYKKEFCIRILCVSIIAIFKLKLITQYLYDVQYANIAQSGKFVCFFLYSILYDIFFPVSQSLLIIVPFWRFVEAQKKIIDLNMLTDICINFEYQAHWDKCSVYKRNTTEKKKVGGDFESCDVCAFLCCVEIP